MPEDTHPASHRVLTGITEVARTHGTPTSRNRRGAGAGTWRLCRPRKPRLAASR